MIPTLSGATAGGGLALPEFVQLAARNGFSGVEFSIEEAARIVEAQSFPDLAAVFESVKVLPIATGLPVEWRTDEDTFQDGLKELPALAKLAQDLDCTRCVTYVFPDGGIPVEEYIATSTRRWIEIARVLADNGLRFGLEFLGPKQFRQNPDNVWFYDLHGAMTVIDEISHDSGLENLGLLVDSFHWFTSAGNIMDLASIPVEQIVHVHINDAPNVPRDEQQDMVRLLPGESGTIDVTGFLKTLAAIGYDGPVAVETFCDELKALPTEEAAAKAGKSVADALAAAGIEPVKLL